jgi:hypothetical protein
LINGGDVIGQRSPNKATIGRKKAGYPDAVAVIGQQRHTEPPVTIFVEQIVWAQFLRGRMTSW